MHILETDAVGDAMISLFEIVDDNAIEDEQTRQDKMAIDYSLGFYRVMRRFLACPSVTVPSSVESGILQFENTDEQFSDCKTSAVVFTSEEIANELRPNLFAGLKFQTVQMSPPELLSRLGVRDPTASFDSIYLNGIITVPFPNESLTEAIQSFETTRLLEYTLGSVTGASAVSRDDALDALLKRTVYTIPSMAVAGNEGPCVIEADDGDTVVPLFLDKLAAATFVHRQVLWESRQVDTVDLQPSTGAEAFDLFRSLEKLPRAPVGFVINPVPATERNVFDPADTSMTKEQMWWL